jgi:hypothetical protein
LSYDGRFLVRPISANWATLSLSLSLSLSTTWIRRQANFDLLHLKSRKCFVKKGSGGSSGRRSAPAVTIVFAAYADKIVVTF